MFCLLLLYLISVLKRSTPVSSQDFYCSLPNDLSRDVTPFVGVFVILHAVDFLSRMCIFIPATIITTM